ncbi:hypothetical protein AAG570_008275 [Ranatra chinensis]|uniref:Uncharacterized protein n=1 Tax=Ranatra chinensis TaxID=642074 RepID=A0ABD0XSS7_9HEMI
MASKRRNMFYENKKQETTKIAILFEYTGSLKMFSESQLDFSTGAAGFWHNKTSSQEDRQLKDVGMSYERFTEGLLKSMVRLRLNGADSIRFGYVIDGYPKTADQAAMLFANPNASIVNTFGPPMPQEINMAGDHGDNFETAVAPANPLSNIGPSQVGRVIVACNEGGGVSPLESRWSAGFGYGRGGVAGGGVGRDGIIDGRGSGRRSGGSNGGRVGVWSPCCSP